jgi:tetratricopeptide (TPR) repeat protein
MTDNNHDFNFNISNNNEKILSFVKEYIIKQFGYIQYIDQKGYEESEEKGTVWVTFDVNHIESIQDFPTPSYCSLSTLNSNPYALETFSEIIKNVNTIIIRENNFVCISFIGEKFNSNNAQEDKKIKIDFLRSYLINKNDINDTLETIKKEIKDIHKKNKVDEIKEEAKKLFLQKRFQEALDRYREAILLDEKNDILYSNIAECYQQIASRGSFKENKETWKKVLSYANKALELSDGKNGKAWYRRGLAFTALGDDFNAYYDFYQASKYFPNDSDDAFKSMKSCQRDLTNKEGWYDWEPLTITRIKDPYYTKIINSNLYEIKLYI